MKRKIIALIFLVLATFAWSCEEEKFEFSDNIYGSAEPSQMVLVKEGTFTMGSDYSDGLDFLEGVSDEGFSDEWPKRQVYLSDFFIDITEVTNVQYRGCVKAQGCSDPANSWSVTRDGYYLDSDFDDFPVIFVSNNQATTYCKWAGKRLPTEAQWEKAARGEEELTFPWGYNRPDCSMANFSRIISQYSESGDMIFTEDCFGDTLRVNQFHFFRSPYQVYNMAGNVAEWVSDWYATDYYDSAVYSSNSDNPTGPEEGARKVYRGGSFADNLYLIRTTYRNHALPDSGLPHVGFRCASD